MNKRTYTIAEAAELTGLTRKAIARRVERGSLQSLVRGGRRMIPRAELARAGLIPEEGEVHDWDPATGAALFPRRAPEDEQGDPGSSSALAALVRELVDRLERQAGEIAHYRAITAEAESLRLGHELGELRARLATLEGRRGMPELGQGSAEAAGDSQPAPPFAPRPTGARASGDRIWLPSSATAAPPAAQTAQPASRVEPPPAPGRRSATGSILWLVGEALFILAVLAGAWLADLSRAYAVAAIAVAWVLVTTLEWLRWNARRRAG